MPFGILEIAIVIVIVLIIFGYRKLPELGRRAGEGVNELRGSVREAVGDKPDAKSLGRSAGKGVRELRELRDAVKGEAVPAERPPPKTPATDAPEGSGDESDDRPAERH